ncbi:hypothetical protein [Myxosarcina sp. GI1]|uniref:hypothetical protein n=1 Tax=Myxosarcina sp. GI1 TaxID=1541065 RepID=UPI0012E034ED|nr:hypothetical protein [Myxosarcina sp. GI1]
MQRSRGQGDINYPLIRIIPQLCNATKMTVDRGTISPVAFPNLAVEIAKLFDA